MAEKKHWYNEAYEAHPEVAAILAKAPGHVCNVIDERIKALDDTPEGQHAASALEDTRNWLTRMRQAMLDMADLLVSAQPKRQLAPEQMAARRLAKGNAAKRKLAQLPPEHPLAPDEVRLAAGWRQQAKEVLDCDDPNWGVNWEPVLGPAGVWRLHFSGKLVRWVRDANPMERR